VLSYSCTPIFVLIPPRNKIVSECATYELGSDVDHIGFKNGEYLLVAWGAEFNANCRAGDMDSH
jgi:hypothetical protein